MFSLSSPLSLRSTVTRAFLPNEEGNICMRNWREMSITTSHAYVYAALQNYDTINADIYDPSGDWPRRGTKEVIEKGVIRSA